MAWSELGWEAAFFSEIERFPCAALAHHYPHIPNHGDMTKFQEWPDHAIDLLVGGTPCQSFSVAGLRAGLADPRGNLMLTYLAIAARYRPRWLVWENVPGVLSSWSCPEETGDLQEGQEREVEEVSDFGCLLEGFQQLGYGFAYRVLDAQFCRAHGYEYAVPQRRRRVFVVGYLGDWRRAAAVLFDPTSLRGDPPPRREAGKIVAPTISSRPTGGGGLGTDFDLDGGLVSNSGDVGYCLTASAQQSLDAETETLVALAAPAITSNPYGDNESREGLLVAHALRAEGFDASEDGTGRGTPIVPISIQAGAVRENPDSGPDGVGVRQDGASYTIEARPEVQAVAFQSSQSGVRLDDVHATLDSNNGSRRHNGVVEGWAVRRLTPRECERLQGFPDDYTRIPVLKRGKKVGPVWAADGPRYKALGNSMAVNVMRALGTRIALIDGTAA